MHDNEPFVVSLSNVSLGAKKCGNHCTMAAYRLDVG